MGLYNIGRPSILKYDDDDDDNDKSVGEGKGDL